MAAYLDHARSVRLVPGVDDVRIAYTALHGVGADVAVAALEGAGFPPPAVVRAQAIPDPDFPGLPFPNPEEPGTLDLLLDEAAAVGAAVGLANDPDADRLGAVIPTPEGGWRRLSGDEIGWLLADHVLAHTTGDDRLVVTTLVSSSLLGKMAAAAGVHYAETYTGFKWIGQTGARPSRVAVRVRLRAGPRLPRHRPPAGQGRHHRRRALRRDRRRGPARRRHAAGPPR